MLSHLARLKWQQSDMDWFHKTQSNRKVTKFRERKSLMREVVSSAERDTKHYTNQTHFVYAILFQPVSILRFVV